MFFIQKFYFKHGRTFEVRVNEELKIPNFKGLVEIIGNTKVLINLNEVELVEITKKEVETNASSKM